MKVAVIGGAGKMGRWFARYFVRHKHEVTISDIDMESAAAFSKSLGIELARSNSEAARSADIIVICTPINTVPTVIEGMLEDLNPTMTVVEISSVKFPVISIMRKISLMGIRGLSVHPLFGPGLEDLSGERMALVPIKDETSEIRLAKQLFPDLEIISVDFEKHDHVMALTLSLTHFINIVLASVLSKEDIRELKSLGGTSFKIQLLLSESIMMENSKLCASIQMSNPYTIQYLEMFLSEAHKLMRFIKDGEEEKFINLYEKASSALSEYEDLSDSYEAMYRALKAIHGKEQVHD